LVTPEIAKFIFNNKSANCALATSILLDPSIDNYEAFINSMNTIKPNQFINETGVDEQAILYFYSFIKKENWTSLGENWNVIPWKKNKYTNPYVEHFMYAKKPWDLDKNQYPDIKEWHDVYEMAIKTHRTE
jgi:hypothetical protein